ncbi:bifunctional diaminohydroxyphosphoribosylaminopyrimidine deaminase/5-amino-6-(5-phosphoribosylamino)uracil reductase RibD [Schumannella luteola]|uniref:Riboflavin biosynthesis protein RibD n=1 Tax=Schumannella luteola TaxID=472059 RepID=A0A852YBJ0_9MICO|nr:bifunctional diaminohydroxyphosphoribosylaminopyrimidine deaminase/5-amino-6-(5-phosphoribosylamino)uracil reductase RibD [Schumannella luteola]NYG98664.1 diaminohydroxyphosphoribosylaminopyrimidine deaminase/5-amino-6-(5-phosphoribosylamino)uracil reductase [Schumannella luteola]TPW90650.1 bifunctional diaminohydroxyphosphoribosylaminopyrimidine deaminase/5-amino-6-(5-phosphoribosylamino)uracil reductase RibD [Schumannella luteola]
MTETTPQRTASPAPADAPSAAPAARVDGARIDAATIEQALRHALTLAARGPVTGGNPQVGCVLLDAEGRTVAEGWHHGAGTPHAEIDALSKLPVPHDARGLTAVVTLEPCNHTGRTGPCSEALIAAGVARVVYAVADPGASSSGGGARLREAGVDVEGGVLEAEAEFFLRRWLTAVRRGRPWVTVKWASTLDGRAAAADGTSQWITGAAARQRVHEQRAASDAILVGTGTVLADDPSLTARGDGGELLAAQPVPVVVGETAVPSDAVLRSHPAGLIETGTRDLAAVLADLDARGLRRVYVEGGPTLASAIIAAGYADEYLVYLAPALLGGDRLALGDLGIRTIGEALSLRVTGVEQLGDDLLITAEPAPASTTAVTSTKEN